MYTEPVCLSGTLHCGRQAREIQQLSLEDIFLAFARTDGAVAG